MDDEDRPRAAATAHAIGQNLDALSIDDLDQRIALLRTEIDRLEAARAARKSARDAAGSVFKPR